MSRITDYSFLFQSMFGTKGTKGTSIIGSFQLSQLNSGSIQAQLRAAGIDTNSRQYKAAIKEMMRNGNGAMYTNIQCIKNSMKCYDKDGDYIDPTTGLAGFSVHPCSSSLYRNGHRIVQISFWPTYSRSGRYHGICRLHGSCSAVCHTSGLHLGKAGWCTDFPCN